MPKPTVGKHRSAKQYSVIDTYCTQTEFIVFTNNLHNIVRAINERLVYVQHQGVWNEPHAPVLNELDRMLNVTIRALKPHLPHVAPWTKTRFVNSYKGRKRKVYELALHRLKNKPLTRRHAEINFFIKIEKLKLKAGKPLCKMVPRGIQGRKPEYNVELGCYTKAIEHGVFAAFDEIFRRLGGGMPGEKTIMKGLNAEDRGKQIAMKWNRFSDPVFVGKDAKRFDEHTHEEMLKREHSVYLECFRGKRMKKLARLLEMQLINKGKGYAPDGVVKYKLIGKRASGDMNTSLGNCTVMSMMTYDLFVRLGIRKFAYMNDGDDGGIIIERKDLERLLAALEPHYYSLGYIMEVEEPVYVLEHIEFCQCKPVFDGNNYRMVRDPRTSCSKDAICLDPYQSKMEVASYLDSLGQGGLSLTGGIPMIQNYYMSMIRNANALAGNRSIKHKDQEENGMYHLKRGMFEKFREPTSESRVSFWKAFNVTPEVQIELEEKYDQMEIEWRGSEYLERSLKTHWHI